MNVPRMMPLWLLAALIVLVALSLPSTSLASEAGPTPAPPDADALAELEGRGTHCVECYLLWDPAASAAFVREHGERAAAVARRHPWLELELVDTDGASFRLADHRGRPVLIEVMATWCPSCEVQQDVLRDARATLPPDTVLVSLDLDPSTDVNDLARYAQRHGYDWHFVAAPAELGRALGEDFGMAVLNPALSPIVHVDRSGVAMLTQLGHKDIEAIVAIVEAMSSGGT